MQRKCNGSGGTEDRRENPEDRIQDNSFEIKMPFCLNGILKNYDEDYPLNLKLKITVPFCPPFDVPNFNSKALRSAISINL